MSDSKSAAATTERSTMNPGQAYAVLIFTVFIWAVGIVIGRWVHEEIPPVGLSFWRWAVPVAMVVPFVWPELRRHRRVFAAHWRVFLSMGVCIIGGGTGLLISVQFTTAINASLVNTTQPALTIFLAWLFFGDRMNRRQILGLCAATLGVVIMILKADLSSMADLRLNPGDIVVLLATASYGLYAVQIRKLPPEVGLFTGLCVIMVVGSIALLPFYVVETVYFKPVPFDLKTVVVILVLGISQSLVSVAMWNAGNRAVGPGRASMFVALFPVFGAMLAIAFLGEQLYMYHLLGALFVCGGIFMVVRHH